MKRVLATSLFLILAAAGQAASKITYTTTELQVSGENNVDDIVARFVEDTERDSTPEPEQLMFLVDGQAVSSLEPHLPDADRVEVMSDGTYVVINVVSEPSGE